MTQKIIFHIFILILAFCGMHILYFSLELKWGATKCPMVCKVGEKCLSQWGNGHNNFYLLLFFLRKPSKISLTFNLITLSFLTNARKVGGAVIYCRDVAAFPYLSTLWGGVMTAWDQWGAGAEENQTRHRGNSWGRKSIKTDHFVCFLFNSLQS